MLPVQVDFGKKVEDQTDYENMHTAWRIPLHDIMWHASDTRSTLLDILQNIKHTAPISNIVCIGLGSLHGSSLKGSISIAQHVVAYTLAQELTRIYKENGILLQKPITIIAQDSAYTQSDRAILSELPVPIETLTDPEGFLAINESSLVFSSSSAAPVKQIIADLATEAPGGKGPAALFLINNDKAKFSGDVDLIRYDWDSPIIAPNPETRGYLTMLECYTQIMDGKRVFGTEGTPILPYHRWLSGMDIYARKE
jgi:hypothetical protein